MSSNDDSNGVLFFGSVQVLNIDVATVKNDDWVSQIRVGDTDIEFKLDSGAQGNVMPFAVYQSIAPIVPIKPTKVKLAGFTRDCTVQPIGVVDYNCIAQNGREENNFFRREGSSDTAFGAQVSRITWTDHVGQCCYYWVRTHVEETQGTLSAKL